MNELIERESDNRPREDIKSKPVNRLLIRNARPEDGQNIWQLVKDTRILDLNSVYCYLLLCEHFGNTCLITEINGELVGFVTAYKVPGNETALFIWQTGVDEKVRGQGIAKKMILKLLANEYCRDIKEIQATVSPSNIASKSLFKSLARDLNTKLTEHGYFDSSLFPGQQHEKENLITIGPIIK